MSKAGFWLRGARGKLAGASIGKGSDGQTIIREIVTPKNPKTQRQIYQRAIMATVMQAYSFGKEIFDHAFEGYSKGAQCQRRFNSLNARLLRSASVEDFNSAAALNNNKARLAPPKFTSFIPWAYQISEGNYPQSLLTLVADGENPGGYQLPAATEGMTVAEYAAANNLISGDIFTVVVMAVDPNEELFVVPSDENEGNIAYRAEFMFFRLIVKGNLAADTTAVATIGQLFDIEKTANVGVNIGALPINTLFNVATITNAKDSLGDRLNIGSYGVIRSRRNEDLRSNSFMVIATNSGSSDYLGDYGLYQRYVIEAWKKGDTLGDSELILEGGEENF